MTAVHVVVPDGIDDPRRPTGGNAYDRHVCRELGSAGWTVHEHAVPGFWRRPDAASFAALAAAVREIPAGALALLDGLIASTAPEVLVPQAHRLRLVVLVHMPLGHRVDDPGDEARAREHEVLSSAAAVVTTSAWARRRLLELYRLDPDRVHVAEPGVEPAELARGTAGGGELLCVAAVVSDKGHDVLLDALAATIELDWRCVCVGRLDRDPAFVEDLRRRAEERGLGERVSFPGPRTGAELDQSYARADLVVLASRAETYGMVVTEALARGLPALITDVGGLPETLGQATDGTPPGVVVPPEDPAALAGALRAWLCDPELRGRLRRAARQRRELLPGWPATASVLAGVLAGASR